MLPITPTPAGCLLRIHLQPRASREEIVGLHGDAVRVRLTAPPVDGAANEALRRLLAARLGVAAAAVRLVAGRTGRRKTVEVTGLAPAEAARRLGL